jgi:hypothetical protein
MNLHEIGAGRQPLLGDHGDARVAVCLLAEVPIADDAQALPDHVAFGSSATCWNASL